MRSRCPGIDRRSRTRLCADASRGGRNHFLTRPSSSSIIQSQSRQPALAFHGMSHKESCFRSPQRIGPPRWKARKNWGYPLFNSVWSRPGAKIVQAFAIFTFRGRTFAPQGLPAQAISNPAGGRGPISPPRSLFPLNGTGKRRKGKLHIPRDLAGPAEASLPRQGQPCQSAVKMGRDVPVEAPRQPEGTFRDRRPT